MSKQIPLPPLSLVIWCIRITCINTFYGHLFFQNNAPYVYTNKTSGKEQGFCIDILNKIANHRNFTYQLVIHKTTGKKQPDGSWTGIMGALIRGVCRLCSHYLNPLLVLHCQYWRFFAWVFSSIPRVVFLFLAQLYFLNYIIIKATTLSNHLLFLFV